MSSRQRLITETFSLVVMILIFTIILSFYDYTHFHGIGQEEDENISDRVFNRFYLVCCSLSSIGYGDISPKSKITRFFIILIAFIALYTAAGIFITDLPSIFGAVSGVVPPQ
jgi:hypothetical protein